VVFVADAEAPAPPPAHYCPPRTEPVPHWAARNRCRHRSNSEIGGKRWATGMEGVGGVGVDLPLAGGAPVA